MADDLTIQGVNPQVQKKDNTLPYAIGGAVVGGAAGGLTGYYTTKPKYASFDDILKDSEDTFKKSVGEVTDDASIIDKAVAARKAGADAAANWDAEFEKAKAANAAGTAPIEESLVTAQNEAEKAYNTKKETLINQKVEELKKNNNTTELADWQKKQNIETQKRLDQAKANVENYLKERDAAYKKVNEYINKAKDIDYDMVDAAASSYKEVMNNIDDIEKHLADGNYKKGSKIILKDGTVVEFKPGEKFVEPPKLTKEQYNKLTEKQKKERKLAQQKYSDIQKKIKAAREVVNNRFDEAIRKVFSTDFAEIKDTDLRRNAVLQAADAVADLRQVDENAIAAEKYFVDNAASYQDAKAKIKGSENEFNRTKKALEIKKTNLKKYQLYQDILRLDELADSTTGTHSGRRLAGLLGFEYPNTATAAQKEEIAKLRKALQDNKVTDEIIDAARAEGKKKVGSEIKRLNKDLPIAEAYVKEQTQARTKVEQFENELKKLNAEGAKIEIKKGKAIITRKDGTVVNFVDEMKQRLQKVNIELKAPAEGDGVLAKLQEAVTKAENQMHKPGAGLTEEQIAARAKEAVTDDMLKTEKEALDKAKKAVEDARANAPKIEAKPEAEIKKALEEKLGTREKVIQDAIEKNKDDLKVALERKVSNKKLAAWIAGGAVVLAGLGYLMAPKSKNV